MAVLTRYTKLSSLRLNPNKSTFVPIAIPNALTETVCQIILALPTQLPITYLGLSLMVKTSRKIHFQPMLTTIQNRLEGWSSLFLSYGGRITLVKAVLSAMPLHFIQAIQILVVVTKHIDRMRRNFMWKGLYRGINCW